MAKTIEELEIELEAANNHFLAALQNPKATPKTQDKAYKVLVDAKARLESAKEQTAATLEAQAKLKRQYADIAERDAHDSKLAESKQYAARAEKAAKVLEKAVTKLASAYHNLVSVSGHAFDTAPNPKPRVGKAIIKDFTKLLYALKVDLQKQGVKVLPEIHSIAAQPGVREWMENGRSQLFKGNE